MPTKFRINKEEEGQMEEKRKLVENEGKIPLIITIIVMAAAFVIGSFFSFILIEKSILCSIIGGCVLDIITLLVWYIIETNK